jgi:RNA polymerase sigma factor (sigma-70 family)
MHHQDHRYIDALVNNDIDILEELYRKFSGKIKWMVMHNHGSAEDAADVFQEGLLSIYRKAKTGNFTLTCPFEAFLYTVCKRRWLKELIKNKHDTVTINENDEYMIDERSFKLVDEIELMQERHRLFSRKLDELGQNCRQLLKLSWSGISMEEVANKLNISYAYARKRKTECMAKLMMLVKHSRAYNDLK